VKIEIYWDLIGMYIDWCKKHWRKWWTIYFKNRNMFKM